MTGNVRQSAGRRARRYGDKAARQAVLGSVQVLAILGLTFRGKCGPAVAREFSHRFEGAQMGVAPGLPVLVPRNPSFFQERPIMLVPVPSKGDTAMSVSRRHLLPAALQAALSQKALPPWDG